jgi:hypothetical protein
MAAAAIIGFKRKPKAENRTPLTGVLAAVDFHR